MSDDLKEGLSPGSMLELDFAKLVDRGRGLARLPDGRVAFVQGALAGERVLARITEVKKKFALAEAEQVLEASDLRVKPECPHYGDCGGCDLMHLEHSAQIQAKQGWAREALSGLVPDEAWDEAITSPQWGYRNRVRWQVGAGKLGFYQRGSHRLLPISKCPVLHPALQDLMASLSGMLPELPGPGPEQLEGLAGDGGGVFLTAYFRGGVERRRAEAWKQAALALPDLAGVRLALGRGMGPWPLGPESMAALPAPEGVSLMAAPGLFCQVNPKMNAALLELVGRAAGPGDDRKALDLYSGWGNLGLVLANLGWRVRVVGKRAGLRPGG